jgi:hypothetical protein
MSVEEMKCWLRRSNLPEAVWEEGAVTVDDREGGGRREKTRG